MVKVVCDIKRAAGSVMLKRTPHTQKSSQDFFQDCNIVTGICYQRCNAFCLQLIQSNAETHVRIATSKGIQDWIPDSLSVELGLGFQSTRFQSDSSRQDSLSCIADSKAKNSFCFPQEIFLHSGIRIPLHWAIGKTVPCLSSQSKGLKKNTLF